MARFNFQPIPFYEMLSGVGNTLSNSISKRKVKDALAALPPDASWNDRASAILSADPTLAIEMGRTGSSAGPEWAVGPNGEYYDKNSPVPPTPSQPVGASYPPDLPPGARKAYDAQVGKDQAAKVKTQSELADTQKGISDNVTDLAMAYVNLDKQGALTDPDNPDTWKNVKNYLAATPMGQMVEGGMATPAQAERDTINQVAPILMNKVRQATHQGARGLDSNVELQFYLKQVGNPQASALVNYSALDRLDRAYGTGHALEDLRDKGVISQEVFDRVRSHKFSLPGGIKPTNLDTPSPQSGGGAYSDGQTATNPQTGKKIIFLNGSWGPLQ